MPETCESDAGTLTFVAAVSGASDDCVSVVGVAVVGVAVIGVAVVVGYDDGDDDGPAVLVAAAAAVDVGDDVSGRPAGASPVPVAAATAAAT